MISMKVSKIDNENKNKYVTIKKRYIYNSFIIVIICICILFLVLSKNYKQKKQSKHSINVINKLNTKCYSSPNSIKKILHLIITRFLIENYSQNNFRKKIYQKEYILNGIRVMKTYLFPSLDNQSCKNFTWILMLGDKANITLINSFLKFKNTFNKRIIYQKDIKKYIRNITKDIDVLINFRKLPEMAKISRNFKNSLFF